jgi:alpha-tubulin suppressor-like RCC1 family protein
MSAVFGVLAIIARGMSPGCAAAAPACGTSKVVEELSIAKAHTCARFHDGGLACWGNNMNGQVGDGTTEHRASPTRIAGLCGVTSVATGGEITCVSIEHGAARCWGLGFGNAPTEIAGTDGVVRLTVSQGEGCGLRADGSVVCWNSWNDPRQDRRQARPIPLAKVAQIVGSRGRTSRFFARLADGSVWRWTTGEGSVHIAMAAARELSCGIASCCALLQDASVACWDPENPSPAPVTGLGDVEHVAAGGTRACVILRDRTVRCWGPDPNIGTFGDGTTGAHPTPVPIPGLAGVRQIDPGNFNACAVLDDGRVKCWGTSTRFGGVVGDGTAVTRTTPVDVPM